MKTYLIDDPIIIEFFIMIGMGTVLTVSFSICLAIFVSKMWGDE